MSAFHLDVTGYVPGAKCPSGNHSLWGWTALDPFTQGYIEALARSFTDRSLWGGVRFSDLAPETLARIIEDCNRAQNFISGLGLKVRAVEGRNFYNGRAADQLTGAWRAAFPPLTVTLSDDGKVRFA